MPKADIADALILPDHSAGMMDVIHSRRLPRWLRVALVLGLVMLAGGIGLFAYRQTNQPKTLTIVAGSLDGYVPRFMSAIAARMAAANAPVRLKVVDKGNTLEAVKAFAAGEAELAIARADAVNMPAARAVLVVTHGVVLLISLTGSIESIDGLKGKTLGVVGEEVNRNIVAALRKEYDLDHAKVRIRDIALTDVGKVIQSKQVHAILTVMPISPWYLAQLRDHFPRNAKVQPSLVPIDSAGAIAAIVKAYESYELPKGMLRGLPPVPNEDLTTIRVPFVLIAKQTVDKDLVESLARAVMEARRDLIAEFPILAQISAPDTDKDAFIPIHPGAAAFFEGDTKTIFDKYGDQLFYGTMLFGSLLSLLAALWKFMVRDQAATERPVLQLCSLMNAIDEAQEPNELAAIEKEIDAILKRELERYAVGSIEATEMGALALATHRLEYAMAQRRYILDGAMQGAPNHALSASLPAASGSAAAV